MQVTVLHPDINLTERGTPRIMLPGFAGESRESLVQSSPVIGHHTAPKRSEGLHVSAIIKSLAVRTKLIKGMIAMGGKWKAEPVLDERKFPLQMCLGMAWEDWLSLQYPEMIYHPGELECDGVAGSPDGITPLEGEEFAALGGAVIEEFKLTYKSGRHDINHPNYRIWLWQVMAYCKMLGTLCGRLHALFLFGNYDYDYSKGLPIIYRVYVLQFTQREIDDNWTMLMEERARMAAGDALTEGEASDE